MSADGLVCPAFRPGPGQIGDFPRSTDHRLAGQRFVVIVVTGSLNWRSA
jgi:hypothetical protein